MYVLGIESSCDETAAAVVSSEREILSNVLQSQWDQVSLYGGVVPELAARSHLDWMDKVIAQAMDEAGIGFSQLDGIAVTAGPGLMGGLIVGVMTAQTIAAFQDLPLVGVNHLEAHALTVRLTHGVSFPYLLLLVSGGHCQLLIVEDSHRYTLLGTTLDDAVGEVFDKTAKLLNLGFPGGPALEKAAQQGDPHRFSFPRPLCQKTGSSLPSSPPWNFSFSGLKTAVRQEVVRHSGDLSSSLVADLCASFQEAVGDVLGNRCFQGLSYARAHQIPLTTCVMAGGVAANQYLRQKISVICHQFGISLTCPPLSLCTDNGAMIAWAGLEAFQRGEAMNLGISPRPRWPLGEPFI